MGCQGVCASFVYNYSDDAVYKILSEKRNPAFVDH